MSRDWEEALVHLDAAEAAWLDDRDAALDAARAMAFTLLEGADETLPAVVAAKITLAWLDAQAALDRATSPEEEALAESVFSAALERWAGATVAPVEMALLHLGRMNCAGFADEERGRRDLEAAECLLLQADQTESRCRHAWGRLWSNRGHAFSAQGTAAALAAAVEAFDQSIALRRTLDLGRPTYRHHLASAWNNRGVALGAQGTAAALAAAESYDHAIALGQTLDLDTPAYRDHLALAWTNRASALVAQGTAAAAVEAVDHVIALFPPEAVAGAPSRQTILGGALCNKGHALYDLGRKAEARKAYGESLDVLGNLVSGDVIPLTSAEFFCNASMGYLRLRQSEDSSPAATDVGDEALAMLRRLEGQGAFLWREKRETLFALTIQAYLDAGQPHFLPELALEHLDPAKPGATPDSAAMQRAAVDGLAEALARVMAVGGALSPHLSRIISAQRRLEASWTLYFGGTAVAAQLRAAALERRGDPKAAEEALRAHVAAHPGDAVGHLHLWAFLASRRPDRAARAAGGVGA